MAKTKTVANGAQVRSFFAENKDLLPEGTKENFTETRGRIPNSIVEVFNETSGMTYAVAEKVERKVTLVIPKAVSGLSRDKKVTVSTSEARTLAGEAAGLRGALSKAAQAKAAEAYHAAHAKA